MEHKEVICYDYEYRRPFERSIRYNAVYGITDEEEEE